MSRRPRTPEGRGRGFALLIVLWALVLLSLLVTHLTSTGSSEARIARNLANGAIAEAAADGAVYQAIFHLLDASGSGWSPDGTTHRLTLPGGTATVRARSEAGKVNPNTAPPELLQALIHAVGVESGRAAHLAAAIADWREPGDLARPGGAKMPQYRAAGLDYGPPGEPFQSIDELGRVLGMTPEILAALRPHLSLFVLGMPDPAQADPVVRAALRALPGTNVDFQPAGMDAVDIVADVRMADGARFTRRAVVRLGAAFPTGYAVLAWDRG